ncbi:MULTISPECIES: hypothetical protein [Acinetobacter]|uniref:hypothetical protein n=1 Tax=Acinetobacter TaxID=469 RepID=UPI000FC23D92|nr:MULTISPECIES: hypothetical protein [Acinetobacter]RUP41502.1 MAG: hypothetical protein EKK63_05090 [Acinetobacter sp.]UIP96693.1 hypothetical protein LXM48_08215 [Acinetobacter johnsonii]
MKVYQINYDLRKQRNYEELYKKIMSLGNWCHPLESCWLIVSEKTASQIAEELFKVMDSDDGLLVTRLLNEASWYNLDSEGMKDVTNWLQENLSKAS